MPYWHRSRCTESLKVQPGTFEGLNMRDVQISCNSVCISPHFFDQRCSSQTGDKPGQPPIDVPNPCIKNRPATHRNQSNLSLVRHSFFLFYTNATSLQNKTPTFETASTKPPSPISEVIAITDFSPLYVDATSDPLKQFLRHRHYP